MPSPAPPRVLPPPILHIKETDAPARVSESVVRAFVSALSSHGDLTDRDAAAAAKDRLDQELGGVWHCVLGADYGAYVTHAPGTYVQLGGVSGRAAGKMALAYRSS
jgi:hypothetical protein